MILIIKNNFLGKIYLFNVNTALLVSFRLRRLVHLCVCFISCACINALLKRNRSTLHHDNKHPIPKCSSCFLKSMCVNFTL